MTALRDARGMWGCWYSTPDEGGSHLESRYATRAFAEAAVESANAQLVEFAIAQLHESNPVLVCGYELRRRVGRSWVSVDVGGASRP